MSFILHIDAWKLGVYFFILLLLTGWLGIVFQKKDDSDSSSRVEDATMALFALLLAFSFSGAADRYEHRKEFLLNEAISIGDFAATSSMLEHQEYQKIKSLLIEYTKNRILFGKIKIDDEKMKEITSDARKIQNKIADVLKYIISEKKSNTIHTPLINGFNGIVMTHDRAYYGSMNQIADTIIIMLIIFGMVSSFLIGRLTGGHERLIHKLRKILIYVLLVTAVFTVTMDLEQPHRGIMRNPKISLIDLLTSLESSPKEQDSSKRK
ncbi:MAG: hypothetical protein L6Q54_08155 [Leptospiraceae bacterium]|nr:hypothetical protein [Leptospiraceae bacterium]MCK6381207.1 hypothetical protein [Leptospiraceae bacterium]NUM42964.1 hypothetical protein [Leptospiraceae bacterium]